MEVARKEFNRRAAKGLVMTTRQLVSFLKQKRVFPRPRRKDIVRMRQELKFAAFHGKFRRPLKYMSSSISRPGTIFCDMANFFPELRHKNDGMGAFLLGVDSLSLQSAIHPVKDLTTESWKKGIVKFAESGFNAFRVCVTDR